MHYYLSIYYWKAKHPCKLFIDANLLTITIWLFFKVNVYFELRETGTLDHGVDITPNNQ